MFRLRHFVYLFALVALAFSRAHGQDIYDCYNGSSEQGGNRITVNGIQSNQYVQQSYPGATVTVFLHNTSTLAPTLFKDGAGTLPLANPFVSTAHSVSFICAPDGRYDVQYSGTGITVPFTVSDIKFCFSCQGGGSGGVTPGTPKQVTRYNSTGTNIEDSSGSDDPANGPTRWVNGLSVESNGLAKIGVNSPNGTIENLLVCADGSVPSVFEVTTCGAGTSKALGVADKGAGTTGNVRIYDHAYHACIFDNQTAIDDYVAPSATDAGQCSDVGGVKPSNVQILGKITSVNAGAGTLATVDWFTGDTIAPGSSGGSGTVSPCATANSNALFVAAGTVVNCDGFVTDDSAGNMTMLSLGLTDSSHAGFLFQKQGTAPTLAVANSVYVFPPSTVTTTFGIKWPGTLPTTGHCVQWSTSGSITQFTDAGAACGTGSGIEVQTNGVDNTSQALLNFINGTASFGYSVNPVNPSGGQERFDITTPFTLASNPTTPTLTPTNPGSTSYTYGVAGCEDPGCTRHSALVTASTSTGNATVNGTNPILVSAYANTLYGYRFYVICRTASSGTPASTGVIASGVWKQFSDNGITADGSSCATTYAANNTKLDDHCLGGNPSITNASLGVPCGVDTPPASPNALDDEGTCTFGAPGDTNSPFWTWVNQNSATSGCAGGVLTLTSPSRGGDDLNCLVLTAPATPYTFRARLIENMGYTNGSVVTINFQPGIVFRESATGKLMTWGGQAHTTNVISALLTEWTNATTQNGTYPVSSNGAAFEDQYWGIQNDGTNIVFSSSSDNIVWTNQFSQAKNAFFTTAPDQVGFCVDNNSGTSTLSVDWWRRTQ